MELATVAKADIFFVITSIGVVLVTICVLIAIGYVIAIARDIRRSTKAVRRQVEHVSDDLEFIRDRMREGAAAVGDRVKEEVQSVAVRKVIFVIVGVLIGILKSSISKKKKEK